MLKHRSSLPTDPCFGTINKTVGQLLRLSEQQHGESISLLKVCRGLMTFTVTQLQLEHGSKKARSDAQGLLSACIEAATSTQARDNNAHTAEKALERLQPQHSDAGRESMHSVSEAAAHSQVASSSAAGSSTPGVPPEVHKHPEADNTGSAILEDLEPHKSMESSGPRESGLLLSELQPLETVRSDHALKSTVRVSQPEEDPQSHHTGHIASALAISPKLETLAGNASQSTDVLVSLGTLLDKIQRIAEVTVDAVDVLAKVNIQTSMLRVRKLT